MILKVQKPELHKKAWGSEEWILNSEKENLCGKILNFKKGTKFSMHLHLQKIEFWYFFGKFKLNYIDTDTAEKHELNIKKGDIIEIPRGLPHQLVALEDTFLFEISTFHKENDSYRIEPGDSQNNLNKEKQNINYKCFNCKKLFNSDFRPYKTMNENKNTYCINCFCQISGITLL